MDHTQLTATLAGLALVATSIVGVVVATQGTGDVTVAETPQAVTEAVLVTQTSPSLVVAEASVAADVAAPYGSPEAEPDEDLYGYEEHGEYEDHEDEDHDEDDD